MELNMTLFVQMGHFLVAYLLVDRLFLRVAVAHVQAEERKLSLLQAQLQEQQERVSERIRHNEQDWLLLQRRLQAEIPERLLNSHQLCEVADEQEFPPNKGAELLVEEMTQTLVERMKKI